MKLSYQVSADADAEPVEIEITGTDRNGVPIEPRTFRCRGAVSDARMTDVLARAEVVQENGRRGLAGAGSAVIEFLESCVIQEDRRAFHDLIYGDDVNVDGQLIAQVFTDLVSHYAERPTGRSSSSQVGPVATPATSTAASPSASSPSSEMVIPNGSVMLPTS